MVYWPILTLDLNVIRWTTNSMMNIVQSIDGKLVDRFPVARLLTPKYNLTTEYFVRQSWDCQETYGIYGYDPYRNTWGGFLYCKLMILNTRNTENPLLKKSTSSKPKRWMRCQSCSLRHDTKRYSEESKEKRDSNSMSRGRKNSWYLKMLLRRIKAKFWSPKPREKSKF